MLIAVAGCLPRLPASFPMTMPENSGNMIHARAPQQILGRRSTIEYHTQPWWLAGEKDFSDFVNKHCDHLVISSMTNSIKVNSGRTAQYNRFRKMLDMYDVPITVFGLGVRSPVDDLSQAWIPDEAVAMLRHLEERAGTIGVRGEFTKKVFAELARVTDVQVTGCPSFFSNPKAFGDLRTELKSPGPGTYTYSGTRYSRPEERAQFMKVVHGDGIYIEPTNRTTTARTCRRCGGADRHPRLPGQEPARDQPAGGPSPARVAWSTATAPGRAWATPTRRPRPAVS